MIDEIAVEIDIVLGGSGIMGETKRIERMHQQHRNVARQAAGEAAFHPADLGGRTASGLQVRGCR